VPNNWEMCNDTLTRGISQAAGSLQTCAGQQGGAEASIHSMSQIYEQTDCEAMGYCLLIQIMYLIVRIVKQLLPTWQ